MALFFYKEKNKDIRAAAYLRLSMGELIDRKTSGIIKGIAVILMVFHHTLGFQDWLIDGITLIGITNECSMIFARATKICVALFAFLTGWQYALHRDKSFKYSIRKICTILLNYWVTFAVVLLFAVLICSYRPSIALIGYEGLLLYTPILMFSWYVVFYIGMMLVLPLLHKLQNKWGGGTALFNNPHRVVYSL